MPVQGCQKVPATGDIASYWQLTLMIQGNKWEEISGPIAGTIIFIILPLLQIFLTTLPLTDSFSI